MEKRFISSWGLFVVFRSCTIVSMSGRRNHNLLQSLLGSSRGMERERTG
ncbi:hypothetical protein [Pasteuria penetrans]|nr:hypothetical protein [Pasteuria penetrans]